MSGYLPEEQPLSDADEPFLAREPEWSGELASELLSAGLRFRRRVDNLELLTERRGHLSVTVDGSFPWTRAGQPVEQEWLLPIALLEKEPVAPDLEVFNECGDAVPVPTKPENMALTQEALEDLVWATGIDLDAKPELRELLWTVISEDGFLAWVSLQVLRDHLGANDEIIALLEQLVFHFVLWVPRKGVPGQPFQVSFSRRQALFRAPIFPRVRRRQAVRVETAIGVATVRIKAAVGRRRRFRPRQALERGLRLFGLVPLKYTHLIIEAHRYESYHLRVMAPGGLIVREVRAAREWESFPEGSSWVERRTEPGFTVQGEETEVAHLHSALPINDKSLRFRALLGIRSDLATLWAASVVLTAALLAVMATVAPAPTGESQRQIAAAVLLVGPSFAAAWAVRSDAQELLGIQLAGARTLLLGSAVLSGATALALALLDDASYSAFVSATAGLSLVGAALIASSWVVTRRSAWFLYRRVLTTPARTAGASIAVSLAAALLLLHLSPGAAASAVIAAAGLGLAATACNRAGSPIGTGAQSHPAVAGAFALGCYLLIGLAMAEVTDPLVTRDLGLAWTAVAVPALALTWPR